MVNEKVEKTKPQESEWKKGTIKKYAKGGKAIWFEGQGTEDNPIWTPVKPTLYKMVVGAGWGAEIKWKKGTFSENGRNKKGIVAVEILKKGTTLSRQGNGGATSEQIARMKAYEFALETQKAFSTFQTSNGSAMDTEDIITVAKRVATCIIEGK